MKPQNRNLRAAVVFLTAGSIMILLVEFLTNSIISSFAAKGEPADTKTRLQQLSEDLGKASVSIAEIEKEIDKTQQLVDDLEKKKNIYEKLVNTDYETVEAISYIVAQEQASNNKRTTWISSIIGLILNILVAFLSFYFEYKVGFFRRWLKKGEQENRAVDS